MATVGFKGLMLHDCTKRQAPLTETDVVIVSRIMLKTRQDSWLPTSHWYKQRWQLYAEQNQRCEKGDCRLHVLHKVTQYWSHLWGIVGFD